MSKFQPNALRRDAPLRCDAPDLFPSRKTGRPTESAFRCVVDNALTQALDASDAGGAAANFKARKLRCASVSLPLMNNSY